MKTGLILTSLVVLILAVLVSSVLPDVEVKDQPQSYRVASFR